MIGRRAHVVLIACLAVAGTVAGDEPEPHPATVDGRPFAALAGQLDRVVDMDIDAAVLKSLSKRYAKDNAELASFLGQLEMIRSVVVTFKGSVPQTLDTTLAKLEQDLEKGKWRRLASIREPGLRVLAFVHMTVDDDIDGLVIVSVEKNRLIFSNLVGRIDLAQLARLRGTLTVPGVDQLPAKLDEQKPGNSDDATPGGRP